MNTMEKARAVESLKHVNELLKDPCTASAQRLTKRDLESLRRRKERLEAIIRGES